MVSLSLSAPAVPGVVPPTAIPYEVAALLPVEMLQFLIVSLVAPTPVPRLISDIAVGAVVALLVIVKLRSVPVPLSDPSMVTRSAPLSLINAPDATDPVIDLADPVG